MEDKIGSNHSKGVCILVNPSVIMRVENCYKDTDRRIIANDVFYNGVNFFLCNVYAPTNHKCQGNFLQILNEYLSSNLNIIQFLL